MTFLDFLKKKKEVATEDDLDIPAAPPTSEELPVYPSSKDAPKEKVYHKKEIVPEEEAVDKAEDYAVRLQKEQLAERDDLKLKKPIFVELHLYKDMVDEIGLVKNIMKENEDILTRVAEFKEDEDKEFKKWQNQILDVQRKLIYADKTLFGMKE